jgi:hypothetical protein
MGMCGLCWTKDIGPDGKHESSEAHEYAGAALAVQIAEERGHCPYCSPVRARNGRMRFTKLCE